MKKVAVVVLAMALLMMLFAVPVMAVSPKKIPVTFTRLQPYLVVGDYWYTGNAYHLRDSATGYNSYSVTGDGVALTGSTVGTMWGNIGLENNVGHLTIDSHLIFQDGTFDGSIGIRGTFMIVPDTYPVPAVRGYAASFNTVQHGVWQGKGEYKGWTLVLEYETVAGVVPSPLIGYLLIP